MIHSLSRALLAASLLFITSCSDDEANKTSLTNEQLQPVVNHYAVIAEAKYRDSLNSAKTMQTAINAFLDVPTPDTLTSARQAWLAAREPYGQTEAFRFYGGPIDNDEDGPEGQINAWPLDEAYIDYTVDSPTSGIIQDASIPISKDKLAELNEDGGEENISTGYHAIEFLLWGQDLSATGPGNRPHTDYVTDGSSSTALNPERRAQYLRVVTELLIDDLNHVHEQWLDQPGTYRADFTSGDPRAAIQRILVGMGSLSGAELAGERMTVAMQNRDQEDEHSCFSDNTHRDIILNALAIENLYLGRYGTIQGPGLDQLVELVDPALNAKLKSQLAASVAAAKLIPVPFDQAILNDEGRAKVQTAIDALRAQTRTIVEVADALGLTINLEE
jgi:putative iron-regulated protein